MKWFKTNGCQSRAHCDACRNEEAFRQSLLDRNLVTERDFACPYFRLGEKIERLVKPVAKLLKLPCLDAAGKLKPQSPCGQRRQALDRLG